jgi:hypothetical protein
MGGLIVKKKMRMKKKEFLEKLRECYSVSIKNESFYQEEGECLFYY